MSCCAPAARDRAAVPANHDEDDERHRAGHRRSRARSRRPGRVLRRAPRRRLNEAELVFGQLETSFATRGTRLPQARHAVMAQARMRRARSRAPASTCCRSPATTASTGATRPSSRRCSHLEAAGIAVVGAGADIAAARQPGDPPARRRHARRLPRLFLDPAAGATGPRRGAPAARRCARTRSTSRSNTTSPARRRASTPGRTPATWPRCRPTSAPRVRSADVVLVSHHWGIHFVRAVIADYQREVARAADRRRRRRDPRPSRAYPQGHRAHRRQARVLQPVQLRHRPAHDA